MFFFVLSSESTFSRSEKIVFFIDTAKFSGKKHLRAGECQGAKKNEEKDTSLCNSLLQRCSVAVLEKLFPYPKIFLYLYINIELIFDFHTTYFGTATLQHCNSECRTKLALILPSASSCRRSQHCNNCNKIFGETFVNRNENFVPLYCQ